MYCKRETRARRATARRALSLMEMVAVTAVMGMIAAMAVPYFGHDTIANSSARGFARQMALDALHARRLAISKGANHYLRQTVVSGNVTEYALYRRNGGSDVQVDVTRTVPAGVTVTTSANDLEFNFSGEGLASYEVNIAGPDKTYTVSILSATGWAYVNAI